MEVIDIGYLNFFPAQNVLFRKMSYCFHIELGSQQSGREGDGPHGNEAAHAPFTAASRRRTSGGLVPGRGRPQDTAPLHADTPSTVMGWLVDSDSPQHLRAAMVLAVKAHPSSSGRQDGQTCPYGRTGWWGPQQCFGAREEILTSQPSPRHYSLSYVGKTDPIGVSKSEPSVDLKGGY